MPRFGETLFSESSFVRNALTPVLLLFGGLLPFLIEYTEPIRVVLIVAMELACFTLLAGLWLRSPLDQWAFRTLSGLVFLAYFGYLIHEFFFSGKPFTLNAQRSSASPINALLGFLIIGYPSGIYALWGRFTIRPPEDSSEDELDPDRDLDDDEDIGPQ